MAKPKNTITEYRSYYLPLHFPVLLLSGDYWKISDIPSGRLHFHNCLEIGICHSGGGTLEFNGKSLSFQTGDITCIPRNVPHTTYSSPGTESHWSYLFLDPAELFRNLLPSSWNNYDLSAYSFSDYKYIFPKEDYPSIYFLLTGIIKELEMQKPGYQISARGLLLSLYIELYRVQHVEGGFTTRREGEPLPPENSLVIAPALDYIENSYMQQISIDFLAGICHFSPTHFRRIFHEIMAVSPLEHLNNTRIMKACNLLRCTEESVLCISENTGFHSVSSFNRYFFRVFQMSPREYRKQMKLTDAKLEKQSILEYAGWLYPEKTK